MTWTPERVAELKELWTAGHSASVIGKRLGVSKNAVVGKAHRLQLTARPSPIRKETLSTSPRRRAPSLQSPAKAASPVATSSDGASAGAVRPADSPPLRQATAETAAKPSAPTLTTPAASAARAQAASAPATGASAAEAKPAPAPSKPPVARRTAQLRPLRARAAPKGQACQWPIGDPSEANFSFCGKPSTPGKPYCSEHCSMAYITKSREKGSQAA
jgi:GcrA cell cycle regulator